jgi:16S rRNA C967 or C1407 C5-methylase (RsmB/RsmF family)/NOL1/NOP2/fmu family ribosome biogenesis protein
MQMENELPALFVERIKNQFPAEADQILISYSREPNTSIQLNPTKSAAIFTEAMSVPWYEQGRILSERPSFTLDPLFHAGVYYPQESSSMIIGQILEQLYGSNRALTFLDACAAPGGKSLLLSSFLGKAGKLVSNEINKSRNAILQESLTKWGIPNFIVTNNDMKKLGGLHSEFDLILVDAPCSGEGLFRKDIASRAHWSEENVDMCAARQKDILHDLLPSLKEGGYLIYSTCTLAPAENENNCAALLQSGDFESIPIAVQTNWNIHSIEKSGLYAYQFLPHQVLGEGFFVSVFRKKATSRRSSTGKSLKVFHSLNQSEKASVRQLVETDEACLINWGGRVFQTPFSSDELNQFAQHVYVSLPGLELGTISKNEIIPAHGLAMSGLNTRYPIIELSKEQALQYLRGDTFPLEAKSGWAIVTFNHIALGWIKVMPQRFNNYFPKNWRIRMR